MHNTLLTLGLICLIAAVTGGALRGLGWELPLLKESWQRWAIALIGAILLVGAFLMWPAGPRLELVSACVRDSSFNAAELDLVINSTGQKMVLSEVELAIQETWELSPARWVTPKAIPIDTKYHEEVPTSGAPFSRSISTPRDVRPEQAERFVIVLEAKGGAPGREYVARMTATLVHEHGRSKPSQSLVFFLRKTGGAYAPLSPRNIAVLRSISESAKRNNSRVSAELHDLVRGVPEGKSLIAASCPR